MSMIAEIEKLMNSVNLSADYRIINLGGKSLYIEGIKSVISFGEEEMRFQLKKSLLIISGQNLKVKYLDKTTCILEGVITAVQTLWEFN